MENEHMRKLMKEEVESPFKGIDYYLKLFKIMFSTYEESEILAIYKKVHLQNIPILFQECTKYMPITYDEVNPMIQSTLSII